MCLEFFFLFIYFSILSVINFFLFNLLKGYTKKILFLQKWKKIFSLYQKKELLNFFLFYLAKIKKEKNIVLFLNKAFLSDDVLILGKSYEFLSQIFEENQKEFYYFKLLKSQTF